MPETLLLRTFLAVAAELSFQKAAQALHVAPSTVTSRIMALEEELGATLFTRSSRQVVLTEAGQRLVPHALQVTELAARTRRAVSGEEDASEVRLRVSETLGAFCLPPILRRFREACPATRVHLAVTSREGTASDLRRGRIDAALLLGEPFSAPGITVEALGREPLVVYTAPDGPLADSQDVGPDDLAGVPMVLTRHAWSVRSLMERVVGGDGMDMPGRVECASAVIVRGCVMAGLGVSVAPHFFVARQARRGLVRLLTWRGEPLSATILLARDRTRAASEPLKTALRMVREFFAQRGQSFQSGQSGQSGQPVSGRVHEKRR